MSQSLPEIDQLLRLQAEAGPLLQMHELGAVPLGERLLPLLAFTLGPTDPALPAVGFFGGVHGLERIGSEVVVAFLRSLVTRLSWDEGLHRMLAGLRLAFFPLVNPGGLLLGTRANPRGVDLMRNSPVSADERAPALVGGQRISSRLPWYRGAAGEAMELESAALCRFVEQQLLPHRFSLAVDCHSGFGFVDRIWFPFAHTARPIAHLADLHRLASIQDRTLLHHPYTLEPQSRQYLTHGDLWDHLYLQSQARPEPVTFLPLTLEMGSWLWIKKNPRQLFSRHGIFNPLIEHRQQRVLRRHLGWLDFIARAALSHERWRPQGAERVREHEAALDRWYRRGRR
ncbi:M14 family zinc carboxypeptidase [Pelomonas sp. SE-A7]|uniref:M14 family zinc carboxypeptidase n=1 Tax=Pelomonas sp. SE-A7 TaxID=3054953 RepID=UPI00259D101C|nr:M14 family zinc carboxypeptidase [Pelomonas sp. SE-A7]MDM4765576.1 M14 family zinc carboxypeptidase [Pelomonas sp. SE-A7]